MTDLHPDRAAELAYRFDGNGDDYSIDGTASREIRTAFSDLALYVAERVPGSRESALVSTRLEEAMFWALAGVDRQAAA